MGGDHLQDEDPVRSEESEILWWDVKEVGEGICSRHKFNALGHEVLVFHAGQVFSE